MLTAAERKVNWVALPLVLLTGWAFLNWYVEGTKGMPKAAYTTAMLIPLFAQTSETNSGWVRKRLWWIAGGVTAFFLVGLPVLAAVSLAATREVGQETVLPVLKVLIWVPLVVMLMGAFAEEIRNWLERRAPDEEVG